MAHKKQLRRENSEEKFIQLTHKDPVTHEILPEGMWYNYDKYKEYTKKNGRYIINDWKPLWQMSAILAILIFLIFPSVGMFLMFVTLILLFSILPSKSASCTIFMESGRSIVLFFHNSMERHSARIL